MFRLALLIQIVYYLFTACWELSGIESFLGVTGLKSDIWLVKTVSVLVISILAYLVSDLFSTADRRPVITLAAYCCLSVACIDFYYAGKNIISPLYYVDGVLQLLLLFTWIIILFRIKKQSQSL
jgi:hypothetical protein